MLVMALEQEKRRLRKRLQTIQHQISQLGPMRPGTLTVQYRKPQEKTGAYYQLSYTHRGKSGTEYIPPEYVPELRKELAAYQRYRKLAAEWLELSIELSKLRIKECKQARSSNEPA